MAGYVLLWKHSDGRFILVDYLCVPAGRRNGGTGGQLLKAAIAHYPADTVFIGETEAPTGDPAADGIILRRLAFYQRTGAVLLGYDTALFGVHFKTICWADPLPEETELLRQAWRALWKETNKPHGFEVIDGRLGAVRARLESARTRVSAWAAGDESDGLEELRETPLPFMLREGGVLSGCFNFGSCASACPIDQ